MPTGRAGGGISASEPFRWLAHYWNDLGTDLQQAFSARLEQILPAVPAGGSSRSAQALTSPCYQFADTQDAGPYRQRVNTYIGLISSLLGRSLSVETAICVTHEPFNDFAHVSLWDKVGNRYPGCWITISPAGQSLSGADLNFVIAHELFHCFEYDLETFADYQAAFPWVHEGEAAWAGLQLGGPASLMSDEANPQNMGHWRGWLQHPEVSLLYRWYDAIGFFTLLQDLGTNDWQILDPTIRAAGSTAAYQIAVAASGDEIGKRWASTSFRESKPGDAWDFHSAVAIPSKGSAPPPVHDLQADRTTTASTEQFGAFAAGLYRVNGNADVVTLRVIGYSRVADAGSLEQAPAAGSTLNLCFKTGGCACPEGTEGEPTTDAVLPLQWAVGGGPVSGVGAVAGYSLDDWCKKKATPTPKPAGLDGIWDGTWHNLNVRQESGTFRLDWKQAGLQLAGTIQVFDTPCLTDGTVTGTVSGNTITFGVVSGRVTIVYTGTWSGSNMAGTYQASPDCASATGNWTATRE